MVEMITICTADTKQSPAYKDCQYRHTGELYPHTTGNTENEHECDLEDKIRKCIYCKKAILKIEVKE